MKSFSLQTKGTSKANVKNIHYSCKANEISNNLEFIRWYSTDGLRTIQRLKLK